MRTDGKEVVVATTRAGEFLVQFLVLCDDPSVVAQDDVATDLLTAVVLVSDVRVEADQAGKAAGALVGFPDDLLIVDAFEELPGQWYAGRFTALGGLIEKGIRDELEALLNQLVVDLSLSLDLCRALELHRKSSL